MDKWYVVRLFRKNKFLFILFSLFIAFQIFFTSKRIHNYPFYIYDMYSRPIDVYQTYQLFSITLDGRELDYTSLAHWKEGLIINTLYLYTYKVENNGRDPWEHAVDDRLNRLNRSSFELLARKRLLNSPEDMAAYPDWLSRYIRRSTRQNFSSMEVKQITYVLREPLKEEVIIEWKANAN